LVEKEMRVHDLVTLGFELDLVKKIERLLYLAEYKRRQSAPGVKVTRRNFGRDRRYPIVNKFRDQGLVPLSTSNAISGQISKTGRFEE
jgi:NAD+ synthase